MESEQPIILNTNLTGKLVQCLRSEGIVEALKQARDKDSRVATLPDLVNYRLTCPDLRLWEHRFITSSEESCGPNTFRAKYVTNAPVYAIAHGNATILKNPERVKKAFEQGLTQQGGAVLTPEEFRLVITGHDGQFPVLTVNDFLDATKKDQTFAHKTKDYVVICPLNKIQKSQHRDDLMKWDLPNLNGWELSDLLMVRIGGKKQAELYLEETGKRFSTNILGNWQYLFVKGKEYQAQTHQANLLLLWNAGLSGGFWGIQNLISYETLHSSGYDSRLLALPKDQVK